MGPDDYLSWMSGSAGNPADNITRFYGQMFRDWLMLTQMMAAQNSTAAPSPDPMRAYTEPFLQMMSAAAGSGSIGSGQTGGRRPIPPEMAALIQLVAQAHMQLMTSGFRYANNVSEFYRDKYSSLIEQITAGAQGQRDIRFLIDEARTYLREIADLTSQEARLLQVELERIELQMNQILSDDLKSNGPHRYWKAKV